MLDVEIPGVEFEGELGRGASAVVYRGRRGGRPCAIKVATVGGLGLLWFRREAAALARVAHRGVPRVMEVGTAAGRPYLIEELVEGEPLADRLLRGPLERLELIDLAIGLAETLDAVHRAGLVHRDVKPTNIILEPNGKVRLVDLGFATPTHDIRDTAGTRAYAAPEQLRAPVVMDGRADLFALGSVLLECLTGVRWARLEPPRLPAEDPGLARILSALLEREAHQRYRSARALARDLARAREGAAPVGPRPEDRVSEALPFVGRDGSLTRLMTAWEAANAGWGSTLEVRGARGTGKSRLLRELVSRAQAHGARVVKVECDPLDRRPISGLRTIFESLAEIASALPDEERHTLVEELRAAVGVELRPVVASFSSEFGNLLGATSTSTPPVGAEPFAELAAEALARSSRVFAPLLLCVDDAQWLDPASAGVLRRLDSRWAEQRALLVLGTRISEGEQGGSNRAVELGDLEPKAGALLAAAYLGAASAPPGVAEAVRALAEGTPLGILTVLDAMLDAGVLVPKDGRWLFDREGAAEIALPRGAMALVARRIEALPAASARVFECAAVVGPRFDEELLAEVVGLDVADLGFALAQGQRAGLVEVRVRGTGRFVHESVREALLARLDDVRRATLHQTIAEVLDRRGDADAHVLATHYAAGDLGAAPERALEVSREAMRDAMAAFDFEAALGFHRTALAASARAGRELDPGVIADAAEAELRLGAPARAVEAFEEALSRTTDRIERARLLGRVAWAHQMYTNPDAAWEALGQAFGELDERMPVESAGTLAATALAWVGARLSTPAVAPDRVRTGLLCELHYQNARLGLENDRPLRLIQSTIRAYELARTLGPGPVLAKNEAVLGAVLTVARQAERGLAHLEAARRMAEDEGDPAVAAYCLQLTGLAALFRGEFDQALALHRELIDEHAHWLGLYDLCLAAGNAHLIESLRGRPRAAWEWLQPALARAGHRSRDAPGLFLLTHYARVTWTTLHDDPDDARFWRMLGANLVDLDRPVAGLIRTATWSARAARLAARGAPDSELDALVAEVEAAGVVAKRAHPLMVEFFLAVAQARIHRMLHAPGEGLPALERAVEDLGAIAHYPLFEAHHRAAEAYLAFFRGDPAEARRKLAAAEELADSELCARVHYDAQRLYAHMLLGAGKNEAARLRAQAALQLAQGAGAVHWERWITEEFGISAAGSVRVKAPPTLRGSGVSSSRRHQLQALLLVIQAGARGTGLEDQARAVAAELITSLSADRGVLVFRDPETSLRRFVIAKERSGDRWRDVPASVDAILEGTEAVGDLRVFGPPMDRAHAVALPLWLRDEAVGAIYLERDLPRSTFDDTELQILIALSYQVPVALELGRALRDRDRLEDRLRHAEKMEALGRFAGGVLHDFNNQLVVMMGMVELIEARLGSQELDDDFEVLTTTIESASVLLRRILEFSRQEPRATAVHDIGTVVDSLVPILRRMIPRSVEICAETTSAWADIDRGLFERALINLAVNARDAMPDGGRFTMSVELVDLRSEALLALPRLSRGEHVYIRIQDDGAGMPPAVRESAFDPFFTTKERGKGTGLGLSSVYGFVRQSRGDIVLESEEGHGTRFEIYLPTAPAAAVPARIETKPA